MNHREDTDIKRWKLYGGLAGLVVAGASTYFAFGIPNVRIYSPGPDIRQGDNSTLIIPCENLDGEIHTAHSDLSSPVKKEIQKIQREIDDKERERIAQIESIPEYLRCFELKIEAHGINAMTSYFPNSEIQSGTEYVWKEGMISAEDGTVLRFATDRTVKGADKYEKMRGWSTAKFAEILFKKGNRYTLENGIGQEAVNQVLETAMRKRMKQLEKFFQGMDNAFAGY